MVGPVAGAICRRGVHLGELASLGPGRTQRTRRLARAGDRLKAPPLFLSGLPQRALIALIKGYRLFFSAWIGNACRFEPSCSSYALLALERHGAQAGAALTVGRLLRCHPWCAGGADPVPTFIHRPRRGVFTSLLAWRESPAPGDSAATRKLP